MTGHDDHSDRRRDGSRRARSRVGAKRVLLAWALGAAALALLGAQHSSGPIIEQTVEGCVQSVDPNAKKIRLEHERDPVGANYNTNITRNGEPAHLSDIQPGDEVRAGFLSGEHFHAIRIEASTPPPGGAACR